MKKQLIFSGCILFLASLHAQTPKIPPYKNARLPLEERIKDLLGRMTTEEKVGQISTPLGWEMYSKTSEKTVEPSELFKKSLAEGFNGMFWATLRADPWTQKTLLNGLNPALAAKATNALQKYAVTKTRLGIPLLFAEECPHGHMAIGTTVFPTSIGQSSTWNPALIKEMATTIAKEARLQGAHIGYGPVLDLAREPRWSRVEETYGEDPVLNTEMGKAMVSGFQGTNLKSGLNVVSTLKHFVAYGVPEGGHNGNGNAVGMRELQMSYLPPFKEAVKAGALSIMTAYNSVDGISCSANPFLLKTVLRDDWGFKGFVVSDLGSIQGVHSNHRVAATPADGAAASINSGLDADLSGNGYGKVLLEAIGAGKVSSAVLDTAVSRVLRIKFGMGLFENPYVDPARAAREVRTPASIMLARRVAQQSIILLKNQKNVLPLSKSLKSIAVIGPNADNIYNQLGDYTAPQSASNVITVLEGIKAKVAGTVRVNYAKGCAIRDTSTAGFKEALKAVEMSDVAVVVLGGSSARDFKTEYQNTGAAVVKASEVSVSDMESGEGYDRSTLDLLGPQLALLQQIVKTGKPVVLVMIKGRPLNLNWASEHVPAILDAWYPGQEGGNAIADVIFGDYNPAGRLPISVPRSVGQLPVYYNQKSNLHDYVETSARPLYSFGYGLSYSSFEYSNLRCTSTSDGKVSILVDVRNSSKRDGDEVVQLYVRDNYASVVTPITQLKKFERVNIPAGSSKTIGFSLSKTDLSLYSAKNMWEFEPGEFTMMVGGASDDIKLKQVIRL